MSKYTVYWGDPYFFCVDGDNPEVGRIGNVVDGLQAEANDMAVAWLRSYGIPVWIFDHGAAPGQPNLWEVTATTRCIQAYEYILTSQPVYTVIGCRPMDADYERLRSKWGRINRYLKGWLSQ